MVKQAYLLSPLPFKIVLEMLAITIRQQKEMERISIGKEKRYNQKTEQCGFSRIILNINYYPHFLGSFWIPPLLGFLTMAYLCLFFALSTNKSRTKFFTISLHHLVKCNCKLTTKRCWPMKAGYELNPMTRQYITQIHSSHQ